MSGGLASSAARQLAAPESMSRPRPESATREPVRQPPTALAGRPSRAASTRERMQASFVPGPRAAGHEAIRRDGPVEAAPVGQAPATAPPAEAVTTRERIVNRALAAQETAQAEAAPGIGDVGRHDQRAWSVRSGPRVWWTESEHVMPFAVGEMLRHTVGELISGHGAVEDHQQPTIMIYQPAARRKASGYDGPATASFESQYIANLQPAVRRLRRFREIEGRVGVDSPARREFTGVFGRVLDRVAQLSSSAVAATQAAVRDEHADADPSGQTNGARRAEPAPLPTNAQIAAVAEEQCDDVIDLARAVVERSERR